MFCCDNNKNKMACYEGMIAGGIIIAASIFAIKIFKKMKCRKIDTRILNTRNKIKRSRRVQ